MNKITSIGGSNNDYFSEIKAKQFDEVVTVGILLDDKLGDLYHVVPNKDMDTTKVIGVLELAKDAVKYGVPSDE